MEADPKDTQAIMQEPHITPWQAHTLVELGGITGNILEFEQCQQIVCRLRTIAYELEQLYGENLGTIGHITLVPSTRPEIRALSPTTPEDALDFLQFHSPD
jgi:hypothetical protein